MVRQGNDDTMEGGMNRRQFLSLLAGSAAAVALPRLAWGQTAASAARKPNLIIIFTDNQGYQDLGCFGSPNIKTPAIDRMAAEGMKFTDFYAAAPVCTPSRAGIMTGCYANRVSLAKGVLKPNSTTGLNTSEITIARLLKSQGYATACIGKWHLGHLPEFLPTRHGFDSYFGSPLSIEGGTPQPPFLVENETVVEKPGRRDNLTARYTQRAVQFITEHRNEPFFLYLPHSDPHVPLEADERFRGKLARGLYGDVMECVDWSTGEILRTLKDVGLDDNTLVVFTSDNGPYPLGKPDAGSAFPLQGGLGDVYEGGMRVPCVMRWPGKIPVGTVCREIATTMDLLPTFAALAGTAAPRDRVIDGKDIRGLMFDPHAPSPTQAVYYHDHDGELGAIRCGKWKFHLAGTRRVNYKTQSVPAQLYDLETDISEKHNVIAEHADLAQRLDRMARQFKNEVEKNARPIGKVASPPATAPS